ncbi:hypothetical protein BJ138DRAFT_729772 [Hygrophoropsis aurantiaca]|uniref:Uncharacterized protein n=1 Tax=Hygrophoropsis aurantiaca TaxID=72124 RepID=A0ACB7ZXD3_9AGAM|nr:hypothetical protein BJ138DRAFT_729772 [Hygrophoropsis aurantiaca]
MCPLLLSATVNSLSLLLRRGTPLESQSYHKYHNMTRSHHHESSRVFVCGHIGGNFFWSRGFDPQQIALVSSTTGSIG